MSKFRKHKTYSHAAYKIQLFLYYPFIYVNIYRIFYTIYTTINLPQNSVMWFTKNSNDYTFLFYERQHDVY